MIRNIILSLVLSFSFNAFAQTKTLELAQSVTQQYRQFRADGLLDAKWLPNSTHYSYVSPTAKEIIITNAADGTSSTIKTSEILGFENQNFYGATWIEDTKLFKLTSEGAVIIDIQTKKINKKSENIVNASNITPSNNHQHIAFTRDNNIYILKNIFNNAEEVAITKHEATSEIVAGQAFARSEFGIRNGIFFSPQSNFIAFYEKDETEVANYPILDISTTPGKLQNIKYPMAGQKSEKPKVGIYNIATSTLVYIHPRNNADDYLTNLSWTPDEKHILIAEVNRDQNKMDLQLYESSTGKFIKTLFSEESNDWVEPEHAPYFINNNSNEFVWVSERDGYNNLYLYDINGKLKKQLTNNKYVVKEIVGNNQKGTEIYFSATGTNPINKLVYKTTLNGKQTLLSTNEGTHEIQINGLGNGWIDSYSSINTMGVTELTFKGKKKTLVKSNNKLEEYQIGTAEINTIKAADGKTDLYTRLIKPSNFDPKKKYPVMIYVYGGPHAQMVTNNFYAGANLWMYWMAEQGYLVFTVDNRGSDSRGVEFEKIIHRNLGQHEMLDQLEGVKYLKTLPYADTDRIAIHGWSYGGYMTISLLLNYPDVFKVGVAGGPVTDWKYYEIMYGERYMDRPDQNPEGYELTSTLNKVHQLKSKLLLIHGTADDVVVLQHNYALLDAFIKAKKQVDYFAYPMHQHNVTGTDRVHLIEKILNYIKEYN